MISEIVLVTVSGQNKPALMSMLTSTLARYQVRVLDVGQAVIHDELSLGMLIQSSSPDVSAAVQAELSSQSRSLGVIVRF
ncbi:MAG: phosphoserine phosphatase SerB, partial [Proteobacteria bacterium]|nr:phosphoserine phosphatase SerB [Pseudomonadota bacterium]